MTHAQEAFLNISKSPLAPEGFLDICPGSDEDRRQLVRTGIPLPDNSVAGIYCRDFVEHLTQTEILIFLRECRRVLQPGGTMRIVTVDLRELVSRYSAGNWKSPELDRHDAKWVSNGAEYLNTFMRSWGRAWVVDETELNRLADFCGLETPLRCLAGESRHPRFCGIAHENATALIIEFDKRVQSVGETPLVSIVVPAYRPDFLEACLQSALTQTYGNLEVVIVDDNPGTEVERIANEFGQRDGRIVYIRNPAPLGEAKNLTGGIRAARGDFIKPLYDDDLLAPDCIERLLAALRATPEARLAIGRRRVIDEKGTVLDDEVIGQPLAAQSGRLPGVSVIAEIADSGFNKLGEPTIMLFRRQDVLAIPEPDVMSLFGRRFLGIGDVALALHLLSRGDLAYVAEPVAFFRIHPGQNQQRPTFRKYVTQTWSYFRQQAARLGLDKSALPGQASPAEEAPQQSNINEHYARWFQLREFIPEDIQFVSAGINDLGLNAPRFHLLLRLRAGDEALLADTLDSLNRQFYANWRVDVASTLPMPEGMENLSMLGWHPVATPEQAKLALDRAVADHACDLVLEIPAGTRLDPICLWRIGIERSSEAIAFFSDDDSLTADGKRRNPRFKTRIDVDAVRCTDMIGPLAVDRQALERVGGVAAEMRGGWYDLLLRLLEKYPATSFRHLPDPLVSLPENSDAGAQVCMDALSRHLARIGENGVVTQKADQAWEVRSRLDAYPTVSILIASENVFEYLQPCVDAILAKTSYPAYELVVVADLDAADPELRDWLNALPARTRTPCRVIDAGATSLPAMINLAAASVAGDYLLLVGEESRVLQGDWIQQLLRYGLRQDVAAVMPRLVRAHTGVIDNVGYTFGLEGIAGAAYRENFSFSDNGYLNLLQASHRIDAAPLSCLLLRRTDFAAVGGLDAQHLATAHADIDLSLKLRQLGKEIMCVATVAVVRYPATAPRLTADPAAQAGQAVGRELALDTLQRRWHDKLASDCWRSPNLSLASSTPQPEGLLLPSWRYLPAKVPRILARPLSNRQGVYRISMPLRAARAAGLALGCEAFQEARTLNPIEIERLGADSLVVQNFFSDARLQELHAYRRFSPSAFIVYNCDDPMTELPQKSHYRHEVPADRRSRFKAALRECDRLVVSTPYLAEAFRHFIGDIRVVPNRIHREPWLNLNTSRHGTARPRIGWAGGTDHLGNLELLKEVIAATRNEADWILFGMCPDELRPLIAEYHPMTALDDYPARLAALNLDIAVAPLEEHPFNRGKSNLRLIEYGALGLPVVCSDIEPYRNSPARKVRNAPESWIEAIRERIHDGDAAEKEGALMKEWVLRDFILEDHAAEWVRAHLPG